MEQLINEAIPIFQQLWAEAKWLGLLGCALLFGIRFFRLGAVQEKIPDKLRWLRWDTWPQLLKWAVPFLFAFAGALAWKMGAGFSWGAAVAFAVTSAAASIFGHKVTKKIGEIEGAKRGPDHEPGKFRKLGTFVIPLSRRPK